MNERPDAFADEVVRLLKVADDGLARKLGSINRNRERCSWDTALKLCREHYAGYSAKITATTDCCQGLILAHRGAVYQAMGKMKKARKSYEESRNLFSFGACDDVSCWNEGVVGYGLGLVAQSCCDWGLAQQFFDEAIDRFQSVKKVIAAKERNDAIAKVKKRLVMLETLREAEEQKAIKNRSNRNGEEDQEHIIPMIGRTAAGEPISALELDVDGELPGKMVFNYHAHRIMPLGKDGKLIANRIVKKTGTFAFQIKGTSMKNVKIEDGDYVIFQYQPTAEQGEIVVVRIDDIDSSYSTIKRFYREGDTIILKADSSDPDYLHWEKRVTERDPTLVVLGRALAVAKP